MRYPKFDDEFGEKIFTVTSDIGTYEVWKFGPNRGRYYLVSKGRELAFKNFSGKGFTIDEAEKWAIAWDRNARDQYSKIADRIHNLEKEQDEIMFLISDERKNV